MRSIHFSKFQKCEKHGINMEAISKISKLSWRAIEQDYSLDKYEEELERLLIRNVIILLTLLPSVPDLPVADSVNCLAGTGLLS